MEDIYADNNQEVVILKSAQASVSELLVNKMLWFVDNNYGNTYFAFPKATHCSTFVNGRVDKAIDETEYLKEQIKGYIDNVSQKRFGFRTMYFSGTTNRDQVISSPADLLLEDEYDQHNPDVHFTVEKRLNNSKYKWIIRISTPTVPDFGIHKKFLESDQRCWHSVCPSCKKEIKVSGDDMGDRWMTFITDNPNGGKTYCCPECKSIQFNPINGYWKALQPDRKIHGYSINRMMTKTCNADELLMQYDKAIQNDTVGEFFMSDLGCPYQSKGSRIYESDVMSCMTREIYHHKRQADDDKKYFIGVDTGNRLHAVVLEVSEELEKKVVFAGIYEKTSNYNELGSLINTFNPTVMVIDKRPETTPIVALQEKFKLIDGGNFIFGAEHNNGLLKPTAMRKDAGWIDYNKYHSIERFYNYVINHNILFPIDINDITNREYVRSLPTYMRVEKLTETGIRKPDFISTNNKKQQDHYLSATIYALAAFDVYNYLKNDIVQNEGGFILL